jgi:hypothetical protein
MRSIFFLSVLFFSIPVFAATQATGRLGATERDLLRHQLEVQFNEVDLLIKNKNADQNDVDRQLRDFSGLKVFDRIPFEENLAGLKKDLTDSAKDQGLSVDDVQVTSRSANPPAPPKVLYTDGKPYHLSDDQLAQKIYFRATVSGSREGVVKWISSWQEGQLRLVEPEGGYGKLPIAPAKGSSSAKPRWVVKAHAFRFRDVKYPELLPRDPIRLLPRWAQMSPSRFSKAEPKLWQIVEDTRALIPDARPMYDKKSEFLLNAARMDFFVKKATPPGESHKH